MPSMPTAPKLHQDFFNLDAHEEGQATPIQINTKKILTNRINFDNIIMA
jgi:hypothetical protein